jgi:hypothetical protein
MSERRAFPRWPVTLDCKASRQGKSFPCRIDELSENGVRLVPGSASEIGEEISLAMNLEPSAPAVEVRCVVRESSPDRSGVEFLNLTMGNRLRIVRFLSERDAKTHSS